MTTFSEQFPIVFQALNVGFLQTLKLFFVTLIGAIPLGLIISFGSMSRWSPLGFLRPYLKNLPKDGKLTWSEAAIGAYTLTVTDKAGKYAPLSASFQLQTDAMPAEASADNQSIVKTADATDADFAAFVAAISNVNVNGKDYAASGKRGVKVIKEDGTIDFTGADGHRDTRDIPGGLADIDNNVISVCIY